MDDQREQNYLWVATSDVALAIAESLETLIHKRGFKPPIYMAAIGSNGYTYAVQYQQKSDRSGLEAKEVAEYAPDEQGARFPIHMLFVDCLGKGESVFVNTPMFEKKSMH